jgi:hypothetical protein
LAITIADNACYVTVGWIIEMSLDALRAYVLKIWIGGIVLSCTMFAIAAASNYAGLTFYDIKAPVRDLFATVTPSLIALLVAYFAEAKTIELTPGQRQLVHLLTYVYVGGFTLISVAMLFVPEFGLNQDAAPPHPAINHYLYMTYLQPLVLAPLFFLFGKSSGANSAS